MYVSGAATGIRNLGLGNLQSETAGRRMVNKMTCRDEVLKAMKILSKGNSAEAFALKVIIDQVLSQTKAYKESTIRTHITSKMCANAPVNHAMVYRDLFRVDVGYYKLYNDSSDAIVSR